MPNTDEPSGQPAPPDEAAAPKVETPAYVTRDELASTKELLADTIRTAVAESIRAMRAEQAVTPKTEAPIEDIDDSAIDAAISEGRQGVAGLMRKAARAEVTRALRESKLRDIDPLRTLTENVGEKLVRRLAVQDMPLYAKSEIVRKVMDEILAGAAPTAKLDPDALLGAYDLAIGRIKRLQPKMIDDLEKQSREETVRRATPDEPASVPGRSGRGTKDETLRAEDVLTDEMQESLREQGTDFATFVKRVTGGKMTPEEYLKEMKTGGSA